MKISGTKEWAATNENIQTGCEHDCKYCYAKSMALRFSMCMPDTWKYPRLNNEKKLAKSFRQRSGRIMFPTTHDITAFNLAEYLASLKRMLIAGNSVLVVSKPHLDCIERICDECVDFKEQILFRFTIGSSDNSVLTFWEPGAPCFEERLKSLVSAYERGFQTSVSCEPMLDADIGDVISAVEPYVTDAIWLGKANRMRQITSLTCPDDLEVRRRVDDLIACQDDQTITRLYERFCEHPKVKWKESIKKVVGIELVQEAGLDI